MIAKNKRSLKDGYQYDRIIPKADGKTQKLSNFISVDDTVSSIIRIVQTTHKDTEKLAQILKRDTLNETCRAIFDFVYEHIQYTKDRAGYEELRRPSRGWADRVQGIDCDCYSIFIGSILYNLKIPFAFRVTKYSADWQHIYPIVYDNTSPKGYRVIDCVVDEYNFEVPYTDNQDTKMSTLYLSGIDDTSILEDLAGLGRAKKRAKASKKSARKAKKTEKRASKKQAKATKKSAKKQKQASKKGTRKSSNSSATKGKKRGLSTLKSKLKKGKEKRQAKRAARREKRAESPKKRGLFAKIKAKKKEKRQAKATEKQRKNTTSVKAQTTKTTISQKANPTIRINPVHQNTITAQNDTIERDEFDNAVTVQDEIAPNEFTNTSKEFMSEDGETYTNTGDWGGDINTDNNFKETALAIREGAELVKTFDEELQAGDEEEGIYPPIPVDEEMLEIDGENSKKGVPKLLDQAITYTKENPLIVGGAVVGTAAAVWGISKLASTKPDKASKSSSKASRVPPRSRKPVNGLAGTKKKGKKNRQKRKNTSSHKAHRKHGRASFNGFN